MGRLAAAMEAAGQLTLAEARDLLGTSRRYAQALLEHMDSEGMTLRVGDARRLRRRAPLGSLLRTAGRRCRAVGRLGPQSQQGEEPVGRLVAADEPVAAGSREDSSASGLPLMAMTRESRQLRLSSSTNAAGWACAAAPGGSRAPVRKLPVEEDHVHGALRQRGKELAAPSAASTMSRSPSSSSSRRRAARISTLSSARSIRMQTLCLERQPGPAASGRLCT